MIKTFFDQGRLFQNSLGFVQWKPGYPSFELFLEDSSLRRGFVISENGTHIGYVVIDMQGDREYDRLSHIWKLTGRYAVVHRMVFSDQVRGKGQAGVLLGLIENMVREEGIGVVRFDTGVKNLPMQRLLEKAGYVNLGVFDFIWGERYAYEKQLHI